MLRRSSLLGVLVPLALLAGQLSTVIHSMAVEHQRCPEHGELVHRLNVPSIDVAAAVADVDHTRLVAIPPAEQHGHDHCVSLAARREIAGAPLRAIVELAPPPHHGVPADLSQSPSAPAALLSLAPKTSPPLPA